METYKINSQGILTKTEEIPTADKLDGRYFPCAIAAGDNTLSLHQCGICGRPPTRTKIPALPLVFLFRDTTSAREYRRSGVCQSCQDGLRH
jgi:hypothetical protein